MPGLRGSSFKGAFRSMVEKLAPSVGLDSCGLVDDYPCVGAPGKAADAFRDKSRKGNWNEPKLVAELAEQGRLCATCKLFGSQFTASKIQFHDLYLSGASDAITQVRDGVAIDRDSEKARDGLLYNFEVVPANYCFDMTIQLDESTREELALVCAGISEYASGFGQIGGKRSGGLGKCQLVGLRIFELDLVDPKLSAKERSQRLRKYLLEKTVETKMTEAGNPESFLQEKISVLFDPAPQKG
jgi:CRISPR-associated RAMP protein (TIGR02581 family)